VADRSFPRNMLEKAMAMEKTRVVREKKVML
jgi:hypothetical protein